MKNSGLSGKSVLIINVSPSEDTPSKLRSRFVSGFKIVILEPVNGAKPPKIPVPAGLSIAKYAPGAAAGATVTDGTRLIIRPRLFSTFNNM